MIFVIAVAVVIATEIAEQKIFTLTAPTRSICRGGANFEDHLQQKVLEACCYGAAYSRVYQSKPISVQLQGWRDRNPDRRKVRCQQKAFLRFLC